MKKLLYLLSSAFILFACVDDDSEPNLIQNEDNLVETIENSTWRISLLIDDGENETSDFSDITLTFLPDGRVEAFESGRLAKEGTWRTFRDDGKVEFWMEFNDDELIGDLSDDWYLISVSNTEIILEELDEGEMDRLTLARL